MDFITTPIVTGIIFYFTYMTFELFARRSERLKMIEKIGQSMAPLDPSILKVQFNSLLPSLSRKSFTALRIGCLLIGVGLGFSVGVVLCFILRTPNDEFTILVCGASIVLFGGISLVISYYLERAEIEKAEAKKNRE